MESSFAFYTFYDLSSAIMFAQCQPPNGLTPRFNSTLALNAIVGPGNHECRQSCPMARRASDAFP